jgi:Protein of unknown function (DUF3105)
MESADPTDDPHDASRAGRPATAAGRGGWVVFGVIGALLVATVVLTITGGTVGSDARGAPSAPAADDGPCTPTATEPLDPNSVVRLLPNAPRPEYASNPPTSGAFEVGPQVPANSPVELSGPVQVGLLAEGKVLVQYRDLSAQDLAAVQALAGDTVVVAPNESLTSPIVATAWLKRQVCTAVDTDVLRRFATLNADRGPQAGPSGTGPPTTN